MSNCHLQLFSNNAVALLNSNIAASSLTIQVQPGLGSLFPQPANPGEWFLITLETIDAPLQREIVKVIGRSGDLLIVDPAGRGYEGTTALSWVAGETLVDHRVTAETLRCFQKSTNFGDSTTGLQILVGETETASVLDVSGSNRSCKWMVTIQTADERIAMTEILAVFKSTGPIFTQYAKVGDKVAFSISVNSVASSMVLDITNTDTEDFTCVDVIRMQHYV